ncbi:MAG: glutathione S-transferase N-terminal domain-containing protein [Steroidobacteraceae bacterium]|jgi:glutathione S-transferase
MSEPVRLYTFSLSHFSEKTRWMLDATATDYREVTLTPFLHVPRALWLSGGRATTVPILRADGVNIQGSARILQWLATNRRPCRLLPQDTQVHAGILDIERRFDRIGAYVIRYAYSESLNDRRGIARFWTLTSGPLSAAVVHGCFPVFRTVLRRARAITPANVEKSRHAIGEALDWLEAQIADGRDHLLTSALSAADITVCALLAPLACPDQHPVYGREDYRSLLRAQLAPWSARPALAWVRKIYREEREFGAARRPP